MGYQNLHTHTTYCDGAHTAEEMIKAAIKKGGGSIGFSEHSYVSFEDKKFSMSLEDTPMYINEVNALKEKYEGVIEVYLGIEMDYFTDTVPESLDFVIGAVHNAEYCGSYVAIDGSAEHQERITKEYYGGDYLAMAESYFATMAKVVEKTGADIVGHFDLVTKHNNSGRMFDEMHPRYISAALGAM